MKNIINFDVDFANIPLDVKKFFYIHNDIYKDVKVSEKTKNEEMVKLTKSEIAIQEFWHDEIIFTWNKDIDEIINLENVEMQKYLEKNPDFWIFLRKSVAEKILEIDKFFKSKWFYLVLKIWYRPLEVQKKLFEKIFEFMKSKNSDLPEDQIYEKTIEFISDPNRYISPHTTWWAVDLDLFHADWRYVDMGSPINYPWEISCLFTSKITDKQRKNREFLTDTMLSFGFSNLPSEWWHFAYWDSYWAKFYWKNEYLYGPVDF